MVALEKFLWMSNINEKYFVAVNSKVIVYIKVIK
jgi:hypothetical protein